MVSVKEEEDKKQSLQSLVYSMSASDLRNSSFSYTEVLSEWMGGYNVTPAAVYASAA